MQHRISDADARTVAQVGYLHCDAASRTEWLAAVDTVYGGQGADDDGQGMFARLADAERAETIAQDAYDDAMRAAAATAAECPAGLVDTWDASAARMRPASRSAASLAPHERAAYQSHLAALSAAERARGDLAAAHARTGREYAEYDEATARPRAGLLGD